MPLRKPSRRVFQYWVLGAIVSACASPGWTLYTYNSSPATVLVRFASDDGTVVRLVGSDSQGFVFVGTGRPSGAIVEFLDPLTCSQLAPTAEVPAQHALVVFAPDNLVQVGVDDPGSQPRDLLPASQTCQ